MDVVLAAAVLALFCAQLWFARLGSEGILLRFKAAKKRDRPLKNADFAGAVAVLVAVEAGLFHYYGVPAWAYVPVLVLSAYVPMSFMFFCNLVGVGNQRELSWMCWLIIVCLASLRLLGGLRLELIIPLTAAYSVWICRQGLRDPYCRYRRGLHMLDKAGDPEGAAAAFALAARLAPEDARYEYHLGRAELKAGREEEGRRRIERAKARAPGLIEAMRKDLLFGPEWIV